MVLCRSRCCVYVKVIYIVVKCSHSHINLSYINLQIIYHIIVIKGLNICLQNRNIVSPLSRNVRSTFHKNCTPRKGYLLTWQIRQHLYLTYACRQSMKLGFSLLPTVISSTNVHRRFVRMTDYTLGMCLRQLGACIRIQSVLRMYGGFRGSSRVFHCKQS